MADLSNVPDERARWQAMAAAAHRASEPVKPAIGHKSSYGAVASNDATVPKLGIG
jgi:hypothetical protein